MNFVCQTFCVRLLDWRSMVLNKDSGDFCFQDIHVSASNFLFHDDKKKGDSCPNWNINMCVFCLHTQLWAKPMRCIPKSTNSYPKQYYHHIIYSRIPQFTPCRPLHVHCIQWHNLRIPKLTDHPCWWAGRLSTTWPAGCVDWRLYTPAPVSLSHALSCSPVS